MSDSLVKRLRILAGQNSRIDSGYMREAAARIEALQAALTQAEAERDGATDELAQCLAAMQRLEASSRRLMNDLQAHKDALAQAEAERDSLAGIVQGWHYLAVGPDEMGDYYTHKQLVKLSEPYASPALRAITKGQHHD